MTAFNRVNDVSAFSGTVNLWVGISDLPQVEVIELDPDQARLLSLRLIKMADEVEGQDW